MKKKPPNETPFSRFESFMKKLVAVPKEAIGNKPKARLALAKKARKV